MNSSTTDNTNDSDLEVIPTGPIQNVDNNAASEVMRKCFTNEIVVNKILQHFSDRRLFDELSFVNKMWNYEARNVMRKRGNVIASFKTRTDENPCEKFKDFQLDFQRIHVLLFDEIRIELNYNALVHHCNGHQQPLCPAADWESNFEATLKRLTLKHFSVELWGTWWDHEDCPAMVFIKRVFHHFSPILETLHLYVEDRDEAFIPIVIQHPCFPCFKIFNLRNSVYEFDESNTNLVHALLSRMPNLQEFHCFGGDINHIRQLLERSSAVLVYEKRVKATFHEISDNVIGALRLERVELKYTGTEFDFERFDRIAPILLQVCCTTTLRDMTVDAVLAVPLMTYGVCLQNVKRLDMIINYDQLELTEPRILRILKDFDFTRIFPSLNKVTVEPRLPQLELEMGHMNRIIEGANFLREPLPDRAINIQELNLKDTLSNAGTQFYAEMFPSIHEMSIEDCSEAIPFGSIWTYWKNLEKLRVEGKIIENLDSVFCGIFPEEVAELEKMDKKYLRKVNIVPVMPAVTCLRNLNDLTFWISPLQDPTLLFSYVTRLTAFKRIRGLSVQFHTRRVACEITGSPCHPLIIF